MEFWKNLTPRTRQVLIVAGSVSLAVVAVSAMVTGNLEPILVFLRDIFKGS